MDTLFWIAELKSILIFKQCNYRKSCYQKTSVSVSRFKIIPWHSRKSTLVGVSIASVKKVSDIYIVYILYIYIAYTVNIYIYILFDKFLYPFNTWVMSMYDEWWDSQRLQLYIIKNTDTIVPKGNFTKKYK